MSQPPLIGRAHALAAVDEAIAATRLTDLETDIDEAEAAGDLGRAERARTEREFLVHELAAATGLGGRARRLGDETEKARKTVTASYQPSGPIGWQL